MEPRARLSLSRRRARLAGAAAVLAVCAGALATTANATVPSAAASTAPYQVKLAYADDLRADPVNFPTPWAGSPNTVFEGCTGCQWDGGAVELINISGAELTVNSVTITYNATGDTTPCVYNIWPSNIAVPAGDNLIITETAGGGPHGCTVSTGQMDGSDIGPNGADWAGNCTQSGIIPSVALTVNNVKKTFHDTGQVLNTGGIDANSCGHPNESIQWTPSGSAPCYGSTLTATPATQTLGPGSSAMFTAKFKNSCNQPLSGVEVDFPVISGPNTGSTGGGTTDATGTATFSYTSSVFGIDTVQATVTNPAGNITSTPMTVNWTTAKLALNPATGPYGTKVRFSGSGYSAGETVDVHWGGQTGPVVATPTASSTGRIGGTFVVPAQQGGGEVQVISVGQTSGKGGAAVFTVTPSAVVALAKIANAKVYVRPTPNAGGWDLTAGAKPTFSKPVATLTFNPDSNTPAISCSNSTGVNSNSRPFTEVVPLPDGTCGTVPIESGAEQAGVNDLNAFDMTIAGTMTVAVAGNIQFDGYSDDGFFLGFGTDTSGSQPTYVSGALNGSPPATTYEKGYPVVGSDLGEHGPQDAGIVVNFPTAGSYPVELDYTECCAGQLQMVLTATGFPIVAPAKLTLSGTTFPAGSEVPFTVSNLLAGETVNLYANSTSSTPIGTAVAASNGKATGNITIASSGSYQVIAVGQTSYVSAKEGVTVT